MIKYQAKQKHLLPFHNINTFYINKYTMNIDNDDKFKKIDIKNRTCYYFDDFEFEDFDMSSILIDEKSYENILVYNISYKNLIHSKP